MESKDITIDNVVYTFMQTDFFKTNKYLKKLTALLKGCFSFEDGNTGIDIGSLVANIGTEQFEEIEKFILTYVSAQDENNKKVLFQNQHEASQFFGAHRSHYYQIIVEGMKFHFLGFLPSGLLPNLSTLSLATLAEKPM